MTIEGESVRSRSELGGPSSSGDTGTSHQPELRRRAGFAIAVVAALLLGTALRLQGLGRESFWFDELLLARTGDGVFSYLYEHWRTVEPPLYDLVMWPWHSALRRVGMASDEAAVRAPIVAMGVAAIPLAAVAARSAFGPAAGVLAAFLLATNPFLVRYAQEARMYALTFLLMSAATLFLVRSLRGGRGRDAVLCGLCGAAASFAHFFTLLVFVAMCGATVVAWLRARDARLGVLMRGEAVGLALVVPYVATEVVQALTTGYGMRGWLTLGGPPGWAALVGAGNAYATYLLHAVVPALAPGSLEAAVTRASAVALGVLVVLGLVSRRDDEPPYLRSHLAWMAIAPYAIVFAVSQVRPVFHPRYLIGVVAALLLLAVRARPVWLVAALAALPIAVGTIVAPRYHVAISKPDYRGAAAVLSASIQPGDYVAVHPLDKLPLRHYARLAAGKDSPLVRALEAKSRVRVVRTLRSAHTPGTPPPEGTFYEIDVLFPRLALSAREVRARLVPLPRLFRGHTLLFTDAPVPYLRVWRRDVDREPRADPHR